MVLLGDVTGMGVAAAALTALVRHTAKTAAASTRARTRCCGTSTGHCASARGSSP